MKAFAHQREQGSDLTCISDTGFGDGDGAA